MHCAVKDIHARAWDGQPGGSLKRSLGMAPPANSAPLPHHTIRLLTERLSQQGQTFRQGGPIVFVSLEFQRHIATIVMFAHNLGDAAVI